MRPAYVRRMRKPHESKRARKRGTVRRGGVELSNSHAAKYSSDPATKVVAVGIDTLNLTYEAHFADDTFAELEEYREQARRRRDDGISEPVIVNFDAIPFIVMPGAHAPFRHLLEAPERFAISIGKRNLTGTPNVRVEVRSHFLWAECYVAAVRSVRSLLDWLTSVNAQTGEVTPDSELRPRIERISRLDLTVDFQGAPPDGSDLEVVRIRSRGRSLTRYGRPGRSFDGYSIGQDQLRVRLYNKTKEITKSGKVWFHAVWHRRGFDSGAPVWRLEAQLRGGVLGELGARVDFDHVVSQLDAVWQYVVGAPGEKRGWMSLRTQVDDPNPSRWPIAPTWHALQSVVFRSESEPAARAAKKANDVELLRRQISGNLSSLAALEAGRDLDDYGDGAIALLGVNTYTELQREYERKTGRTMPKRAREKQRIRRAPKAGQRARRLGVKQTPPEGDAP